MEKNLTIEPFNCSSMFIFQFTKIFGGSAQICKYIFAITFIKFSTVLILKGFINIPDNLGKLCELPSLTGKAVSPV